MKLVGGSVIFCDLGNTLFRRPTAGPLGATIDFLKRELLVDSNTPIVKIAEAVFLSNSPGDAIDKLSEFLSLSSSHIKDLTECLNRASVSYELTSGAKEFLERSRKAGWEIVAATNVVSWNDSVPDCLRNYFGEVFTPIRLGAVKQDSQFWCRACSYISVNPSACFSIGDSLLADVATPQSIGMSALHISGESTVSLEAVTAAIPDLSSSEYKENLVVGVPTTWAGHRIVEVPQYSSWVQSVTRCMAQVRTARGSFRSTIVRRNQASPALVIGPSANRIFFGWLNSLEDVRQRRAPPELAVELTRSGLNIENLDLSLKRHLFSMVREAKDQDLRQQRIADIIAMLKQKGV